MNNLSIKCPQCGWAHNLQELPENCYNCSGEIIPGYLARVPTTQKARGMKVLKGWFSDTGSAGAVASYLWLISAKEEIDLPPIILNMLVSSPHLFARPCPPSPEHGFVESRIVKSIEDIEQVRKETLAANESSEIMLCYPIAASYNAVWIPTRLTVGPGHDGATAGKDTVSIPLVGASKFPLGVLRKAKIDPVTQAPYVEVVYGRENTCPPSTNLTQLRAGPKLGSNAGDDFIPAPTEVKEIIRTNGEDLLEWARVVRGLKGKDGTVVYHPGGSVTDHYSVHCRENGVPIMITREPQLGEVLEEKPVENLDPIEVLRGLTVTDRVDLYNKGYAECWTALALTALHNSAVMRGPHSFWLGIAAGAILKLGSAALNGEARHAHGASESSLQKRGDLHHLFSRRSISHNRSRLSRITQLLHYGFGDPNSRKSYGGRNWALCGAALVPLFNAVRKLAQERTPDAASEVVLALNIAVNQAHNGGWWLNKFINANAYTQIPAGHVGYIAMAGPAIYAAHIERDKVDVDRFIYQASNWPVTEIKPLAWRKAMLQVTPTGLSLSLKAATVPQAMEINVPLNLKQSLSLKNKSWPLGKINIQKGRIEMDFNGEVVPIWEEQPLIAESRKIGS